MLISKTLERNSKDPKPMMAATTTRTILLTVNTDFWRNDLDMMKNPMKSPKNHNKRNDRCINPPTMVMKTITPYMNIFRPLVLIPESFIIGRAAIIVTTANKASGP